MLTALYPIANTPATVTVVAPGALAGDEAIPVAPIMVALPAGYILDFGTSRFAKLAAPVAVDDDVLDTAPIPLAIVAGAVATVPGSSASSLLGQKWTKLGGPDISADDRAALQRAYHLDAEMALDLRAPVYTGAATEELAYAVVHQVLFMIEHGITPSLVKSTSQGGPSAATKTYRDRWIDPTAALIVARVTGRRQVRYEPPMVGV